MKVYLTGIGMGDKTSMTDKCIEIINFCTVLIGARRMVDAAMSVRAGGDNPDTLISYNADEICQYVSGKSEKDIVMVALSGDVGFYSGADKLYKKLSENDISVILEPGISSVNYMAAKCGITWNDMKLISSHGRDVSIVPYVRDNRKVFAITDGISDICGKLVDYDLGDVTVYIGSRLSYDDEKIIKIKANEYSDVTVDESLVSIIIINENADNRLHRNISDEEFVRTKNVPMTKKEIRGAVIANLELDRDSVLFDIGGGTGSVSIECSMLSPTIKVYSYEKKPEAVELLKDNIRKFKADNVKVVRGIAPDNFEDVVPTHAFIGGSDGRLEDIVNRLLELNGNIRIVVTAVSIEAISGISELMKLHKELQGEITLMQCARSKAVGEFHLMNGNNPVYIVVLTRREAV